MNFSTLVINFLVGVICLLVVTLQHFYIIYCDLSDPTFEDMFLNEDETYNKKWHTHEATTENSLHEVLNTRISIFRTPKTPIATISKAKNSCKESEVKNSLRAALDCASAGKVDKALKLYEHAAALAPQNPDVLNYYGEFIERTQHDIIGADELYYRAITYSPDHQDALMNRDRTAHIVEKLDLRLFQMIDKKRDRMWVIQKNPLFDFLKKEAYYLQIYHTVGIEGNTMTLKQMRYLLETGKVVNGKSLQEHNEVIGLQSAMSYVKTLINSENIFLNEILGIHKRVLGHVDPITSGRFRNDKVYVGNHKPPPPEDVYPLMESYVKWLNSEEARSMHPVRYAALAHYKLVDIHPFADGNGRTSRLIMNLILIRSGYPPVFILKHHRENYYQFLTLANKGDVRPFVRFIAHCLDQTLEAYLWTIARIDTKSVGESNKIAVSSEDSRIV